MDAPQNIPTHPSIANTTLARAQPADPRPVTIAILLGLAAAAVPSAIAFLLPSPGLKAANEHARLLLALGGSTPLLLGILIASARDWANGKGSLRAAARTFTALLLVALCYLVAVLLFWPLDFAGVGDYIYINFAIGLAATFATSGSATYADSSLARLAWGASFAVLLIDLVILALAAPAQPGPASTGLLPNLGGYAILALGSVIFLSVIASITVVRLGGIVGGWLRRGYR